MPANTLLTWLLPWLMIGAAIIIASGWWISIDMARRHGERCAIRQLHGLLDSLSEALVLVDENGGALSLNATAYTTLPLLGVDPSDAPGVALARLWQDAMVVDDAPGPDSTRGLSQPRHCRQLDREGEDGSLRRFLIVRSALTAQENGMQDLRIAWAILDISPWRRHEAALQNREALVSSLINATADMVMRVEQSGVVTLINDAGAARLGKDRNAVLGRPLRDLFPPSVAADQERQIRAVLNSGKATRYSDCKDGTWVEHSVFPVMDETGHAVAVTTFSRDITAERRLEHDLRHREQFIRLITDNIPGLIFYTDESQIYRFINRAALEWLGRKPHDVIGRRPEDVLSPQVLADTARWRTQVMAGNTVEFDGQFTNPRGRDIRYHAALIPHLGENGSVQGCVGLALDITKRQEAEEQTRDALAQAEMASAAKSRFLAAASHDLRQPMQALSIYSSLLTRQLRTQPKAMELARRVELSVDALGGLLDSLLDISKLDAGIVQPTTAPFSVGALFDRMDSEMRPLIERKGLTLSVVPSRMVVESDERLIERIVRNLMTNAYRYTQTGGVLLGCRRRGEDEMAIQVVDTGIGIPDDRLDLIFEEFYQVGNEARDRTQGLGLGLAIVQRLSRLLGHPVHVRSVVGRGTCMEIILPLAEAPALQPLLSSASNFAVSEGAVAVIVEDDAAVLDGMATLLEDWGFEVVAAQDILEAFDALRGMPQPTLVLADYRLQGGATGVAAIQSLSQAFGSDLPGVIMTGDTSPERLREVQRSGYRLLHKPVRTSELRDAIAEVLSGGVLRVEAG